MLCNTVLSQKFLKTQAEFTGEICLRAYYLRTNFKQPLVKRQKILTAVNENIPNF